MDGLLGPAVIAAGIAAFVSVAGWWVSHEREKREQSRQRLEKIRDIMTALRSEIRSGNFSRPFSELESRPAMVQEMVIGVKETILASSEGEPQFTPFVTREPEPVVFSAVVAEIHILPGSVIDPVILYYSQLASIAEFADDLRSERYALLTPERKAAMYEDYMEMRAYAADLAADAIRAIDEVTDAQ